MTNEAVLHSSVRMLLPFFLPAVTAFGLYLSSLYSFPLFHSLAVVLYVATLLTIFLLTWNVRTIVDNHYFLLVSISLLFTAAFALMHTLAYKGFGIYPGEDANLPTQLWIVSRYLFSLSLLIAPLFIVRRLNVGVTTIIFAVLTALLFAAIFSGVFPQCFIEGQGLTPFAVYSQYFFIGILMAALGLLIGKRTLFDPRVFRMLTFSIVSAAAADAAFIQSLNAYGQVYLIGYFFLFLSAVLIYRAIVITALTEPRTIIDRNLEQSRQQLKRIAETSIDLIFQLDTACKVVFCSPAIVRYGYSVAGVIGNDFSELISHDDRKQAISVFRRVIGGSTVNALELCLLGADGTLFQAEINVAPLIVNGAVIGLQGVSRDVTNRKKTEEALRESDQFNKLLLDTMGSLLVVLDIDGRIRRFNKACEKVTGYTLAEVRGRVIFHFLIPEEEREGVRLIWQGLQAGNFPNSHENHWVAKDGSLRLISWTNTAVVRKDTVVYVIGAGLDITAQKRAQAALKASAIRYRHLAESIPAMLWAADLQGAIVDCNCRWYQYSGQSVEQSRRGGWREIVHPDDVQRVVDTWAHSIQTGEDYVIEHRLRRASDGTYRWHSARARLRKDRHGTPLDWFGTCVDIDDRKRAENALWESEERLRMVLEASSIGTFELNFQTGEGQWNSVEYELLGLKANDVHCHPELFFQYVHPDDIKAFKAEWKDALLSGELNTEFRIVRADGRERWLAVKGRFLDHGNSDHRTGRFLGVNFDITDRKLIEQKLRESEALYRSIGESIDYGVWVCTPDGRNTYASESFLNMVGLTQEQCSNFGWGKVLHPDDADRTIAAWQECVRTGSFWDIEHRYRGKDDQWHHVLARGVPVRNGQGDITCWAGINLDITRLKQAEEQVTASLTEKEVMLREIHHRVKNNLQVISSLISLQADIQTDERLRQEFNDVRNRVRAMALIHEKLYQTGNLARLNFAEYVAGLLHFLWRSHGALAEKVRLHLAVEPVTLPIEIAVPCGLILNELVGNALKHAFPDGNGGEVTVGLHRDPLSETVSLRVCDNGVGLQAELDWRQTHSLGLRLVRILARQLCGTVEKGEGPGTAFIITFHCTGYQHHE